MAWFKSWSNGKWFFILFILLCKSNFLVLDFVLCGQYVGLMSVSMTSEIVSIQQLFSVLLWNYFLLPTKCSFLFPIIIEHSRVYRYMSTLLLAMLLVVESFNISSMPTFVEIKFYCVNNRLMIRTLSTLCISSIVSNILFLTSYNSFTVCGYLMCVR